MMRKNAILYKNAETIGYIPVEELKKMEYMEYFLEDYILYRNYSTLEEFNEAVGEAGWEYVDGLVPIYFGDIWDEVRKINMYEIDDIIKYNCIEYDEKRGFSNFLQEIIFFKEYEEFSNELCGLDSNIEEITIDDFAKIDLRVVKVLACEPIKKAKKLLKLKVDLNGEERQVVSGIAMHYKPEDLVGKYVVLVANLKPVTLRGELSQGMILAAATDDDSLLTLVNPGELPTGSQVR